MKRLIFNIMFLMSCSVFSYENTTLNISAAGGLLSGSGYTNIGAIIPLGGQSSQIGFLSHQSGFAAGFILQPETAFGVLPDELNPDNDSDGLADGDEIVAGSCLYKSDTDGDGLSDPDELIAGTSPTNSLSVLAVDLAFETFANELSWFGVSGRYYQIEYTDDLGGIWTPLGAVSPGSDAVIQEYDFTAGSKRYYRVRVSDNPADL